MAENTGTGYWRGLVTGLLLGAGATLLLGAKNGNELRNDIAEGTANLMDGSSANANEAADALAGTLDDAETVADEASGVAD